MYRNRKYLFETKPVLAGAERKAKQSRRELQKSVRNKSAKGFGYRNTVNCPKRSRLSRSKTLHFTRQQPFNTLRKLTTDSKQDLRPNLHLAAFYRGAFLTGRLWPFRRGSPGLRPIPNCSQR